MALLTGLTQNPMFNVGAGLLSSAYNPVNPWGGVQSGLLAAQQGRAQHQLGQFREMQMQQMQQQEVARRIAAAREAADEQRRQEALAALPPELQPFARIAPTEAIKAHMAGMNTKPETPDTWVTINGQPQLVTKTEAARLTAEGKATKYEKPEDTAMTPYQQAQLELSRERLDVEKNAKKNQQATDTQNVAGGYFERMAASEQKLSGLRGEGYDPTSIRDKLAPNFLKSDEGQMYQQAQDDWIRAKLRKESGAVISDEEMESERRTYFPQIGDSEAVIRQKAEARKRATEAMRRAAGPAAASSPTPSAETGDGWSVEEVS